MSAGKGDRPRRVDGARYRENYDNIFRKKDKCKTQNTPKRAASSTEKDTSQ